MYEFKDEYVTGIESVDAEHRRLFEIADEAYAVENAVDELKAIATGVIEGNNSDGVAKWLCKRFSGENTVLE